MVSIVGVTTALVAEPPPAQAAGSGPVSGRAGRPVHFTLTVDPARVGPNEMHVYLLDPTGQLAAVDEIRCRRTLPAVDVGPLRSRRPRRARACLVAAAELPLPGDWQLPARRPQGRVRPVERRDRHTDPKGLT